jgi:AcrR family transcriptional regulator
MATRESLLDVTARLYAEHGWRGTTTRRIAEAAGVNEVTLFRQFGSKERLLLQAIRQASVGEPTATLPEVPKSLAKELTVWAVAHHRSIAAKSGMIRSCLAESEERPALAPKACEGGAIALADGRRYLGAARELGLIGPEASIEGAMLMLVNAIFMDAMIRDIVPAAHERSPDESVALFVDVVLRALGARDVA